jgi:hypothetical protein
MNDKSITNTNIYETLSNFVNQDVRTTPSPTFVGETLTNQLILNTGAFHPIIVNQSSSTSGSDILFQENGTNIVGFGDNVSTGESYVWNYANRDLKFGTNSTERLRIQAGGISSNPTATQLLSLNGTDLTYTNVSSLPSSNPFNQSLNTTNNVQFANIIDSGLTASTAIIANSSKQLTSTALLNGQVIIGSSIGGPVAGNLTTTSNITLVNGPNSISLDTVQPIQPNSSVTFGNITDSGISANEIVTTGTAGLLQGTALTNGQLLIGSTSAAPVAKTLTGTTNEVVVTNTAGTITLSTPQPIGTTSQVQFPNIYCGSSTATFDCPLQFDSTTSNRKITLFETANNQFQYYGFGIAAGTLIYNVGVNTSNHVFSSAFSSSALTTLFTIFGNQAGVSIPNTTSSPSYAIGSSLAYGLAGSSGAYFSNAVTNDLVLRNSTTSNNVLIGVGTSKSQLAVSNTSIQNNAFIVGGLINTVGAGPALGTVPLVPTLGGSQMGGTVNCTTSSTGLVTGVIATFTLPVTLSSSNFGVVLSPANATAANATGVYATSASTTTFTINTTATLSASTIYAWNYMVVI